jgi:hypothetical protein
VRQKKWAGDEEFSKLHIMSDDCDDVSSSPKEGGAGLEDEDDHTGNEFNDDDSNENNDDSDEAEFEDDDDNSGNEFNDDSDEENDSSDGECGDTRVFEQMKHLRYINIKNLSRAIDPCDFKSKAGWRAFGACLRCPDSAVEYLRASDSNAWFLEYGKTNALLNDATLGALSESVAMNSSLKELYMDGSNCSSAGWTLFFYMLKRHTKCSLEVIGLSKDDIDNLGWKLLSWVLCDKSSILDTFTSNHTLRRIDLSTRPADDPDDFGTYLNREEIPDHVASLLRLNSERNKAVVARHKILTYQFPSGSTNIQVFVGMTASTLPHAMEWIARDYVPKFKTVYNFSTGYKEEKVEDEDNIAIRGHQFSLMYRVIRGILPSLSDTKILSDSGGIKRKMPSS